MAATGVQRSWSNGAASIGTQHGRAVLRDPHLNRGTAYTREERAALGIAGLLPPDVQSLEDQARRSYEQYSGSYIGCDKAAAISHRAGGDGTSLRAAALALGVSATDFDRIVVPERMVGDPRQDLGLESAGNGRK